MVGASSISYTTAAGYTGRRLLKAVINISTATTTEIIAATANKTIVIESLLLVTTNAQSVTLLSAAIAVTGAIPLSANGGIGIDKPVELTVSEAFNITNTIATQTSGYVTYYLK